MGSAYIVDYRMEVPLPAAGAAATTPLAALFGKGGKERRVPLHPGLVALMRSWRSKSGRVCDGPEAELTGRGHVQRSFNRAWRRAGVDPRVWQRQPTHAARKAFFTGLCAAGVELLQHLERLLGFLSAGGAHVGIAVVGQR